MSFKADKFKKYFWWKPFSITIVVISDLIWVLTLGLKAKLLYLFYTRSSCSDKLRKSGLEIIRGDTKFVNFSEFLRSNIPGDLVKTEIKKIEESASNEFSTDLLSYLDISTRLEILKFALDEKNIAIVCGYLKFVPRLATVKILLNTVNGMPAVGSQKWHRDWFNYKSINIFMNLTNVDSNNGLYSAISNDWISKYSEIPIGDRDKNQDPWDRDRILDHEMEKYVSPEKVETLEGPPGTTALVDSSKIYHKGGDVHHGYRIMIEISYQSEHKPGISCPANILEVLGVENHHALESIIKTPVQKYMVNGFKKVKGNRAILHWISRKFTYYAPSLYG